MLFHAAKLTAGAILSPRTFLTCVFISVSAAMVFVFPGAVRALMQRGGSVPALGFSMARTAADAVQVARVDANGPAAGRLQPGDRILALNGYPPPVTGLGWVAFMDLRAGDSYAVRVWRGGSSREYSLTMGRQSSPQKLWFVQVPLLAIALLFLVTGAVVAVLRPADLIARLYATLGVIVATALIPFGAFPNEAWQGCDRFVLAAARVVGPLVLPVAYHFFLAFHPGGRRAAAWSRLKLVLYLASAVLLPGAAVTAYVTSHDATTAMRLVHEHRTFLATHDALSSIFTPVAACAVVGLLIRNHFAVADLAQRRRLRLVLWGSILSAGPFALLVLSDAVLDTSHRIAYEAWLRLQGIAELFLVFLPLTFAYAVVKHRVIGIDVVIRRSLQYLLARQVLQAALFLPLVLLIAKTLSSPTLTVAETLFDSPLSVALVVCSTLALSTRHRLRRWLDRRFFRDAADRDQLLLQLVEEIKHHDTPDDMARLVGQRLEGALHPAGTRVHFLEASSEGAAAEVDPSLLQTLDQRATPQDIGFDLAVPIGGGGRRLHGLLLLGPKRSEEPYSREDRRLLQAIADQMAILCENNALRTDAAHHLKIQQHVLAHAEASGVNLLKECPACGRCFDRDQESCDVDGTPVVLSLPVDRTIDGRYRLERLLGRGGMASVYLASDRRLGREVAVKLLKAPGDTGARRRFEREARTSARLRHPHIVTVHDFGSVGPELGYLVMERLTGTTLRDELRTRGAVAPRVAAEWFDQILSAVAFAHAEGIVHRDLKPENVFIAREADGSRTVKVLDFGLAKLTASDATTATNLTDAGAVLGTLAYMSPEQIAGESTDERTDIFALGVLAIETVTGRHPFRRDDQFATVAAILNERAGIAGGASDIRALDAVIQRCCAKNAAERFSAVADMRAALLPALRGCSSLAIRT